MFVRQFLLSFRDLLSLFVARQTCHRFWLFVVFSLIIFFVHFGGFIAVIGTKSAYSLCMDNNVAAHPTMHLNQSLLNHTLLPMSFLEQTARPMLISSVGLLHASLSSAVSIYYSCLLSPPRLDATMHTGN